MSERQCPVCGRHFFQKTGQHRFCTTVCRERARASARVAGSPARYGHEHQKLRQAVSPQVATGKVICPTCREPIRRGQPWDLGHDKTDPSRYLGPEHASCNRATAKVQSFEDDPDRGVFWGPPPESGGTPQRWSRAWFDWRVA
jgi:hypothetical protein